MFSFFNEFASAQKIVSKKFDVIFFAESRYYFQYFKHLFDALTALPDVRIAYVSSDKHDEVLRDQRVEGFYLKTTLAGVFPRLQANAMILTMPDLQNFIFKKSPSVKKYVYVFHALVSTHQQYRAHAFDHYDAVFCTGPQQVEEIRESEGLYSLPAKEIIGYGYPLLQTLKEKAMQTSVQLNKVLIAPSWYSEGILNTCILPLLNELRKTNKEVWIRPHPEFVKRNKKAYQALLRQARNDNNIHFDKSPSVYTHLLDAAHLITDRSGIALEYAFTMQRPVMFIDTPLKIQNPDVKRFRLEPLENRYRKALGRTVAPSELHKLNRAMDQSEDEMEAFKASILKTENEVIFPVANGQRGVEYIKQLL